MKDQNVKTLEELRQNKQILIEDGIIEKSDVITIRSFVVGRELDSIGNEINPLFQFNMNEIGASQIQFLGKRAGDVIELERSGTKFEILEVYRVKNA